MNILFQSRFDLFKVKGGDTVQIQNTKESLEKLGHKITINSEVHACEKDNYDLVHLFNIDWIVETYFQFKQANRNNIPTVLSAIHHSEQRQKMMEDNTNYYFRILSNSLFEGVQANSELKNLYRGLFQDPKRLPLAIKQIASGMKNQQRYVLEHVNQIIVQTEAEKIDLLQDFKLQNKMLEKMYKIENGVNLKVFKNATDEYYQNLSKQHSLKNKFIITCTGRLEPRKNQKAILKAISTLDKTIQEKLAIIFIGNNGRGRNSQYINDINNLSKKVKASILQTGLIEQSDLASILKNSDLFVLPSWYETSGLVYLEALVLGLPIIYSTRRADEYIGQDNTNATYVEPDDIDSLAKSIKMYYQRPKIINSARNVEIMSWDEVAVKLDVCYKRLLTKD